MTELVKTAVQLASSYQKIAATSRTGRSLKQNAKHVHRIIMVLNSLTTSPPVEVRGLAISVSVSVCLSTRISQKQFYQFY